MTAAAPQVAPSAGLAMPPQRPGPEDVAADMAAPERRRLLVAAVLALPVLVLSVVPGAQFRNWQWLCFVLAAPLAVWGAWPFHQRALREPTVASDTLVSLAVVASFVWSAYALFLGGAGEPGARLPFDPTATAGVGAARPCPDAVAGVVLCALAGRCLEARAGRRTAASAPLPADAMARACVPMVAAVAVTVPGFWLGAGAEPRAAVAAAVAVLVVAAPCSLLAAVPATLLSAALRGARIGVRVRRPRALEALRAVDTVVLNTVRRPGDYRAVRHLKRLGLRPVLVTGEQEEAARAAADRLGIAEAQSGVGPRDKAVLVRELRERGHRVAVVGEGAEDAAALAEADLGIALGDGDPVAVGAADMTLTRGDVEAVVDAIRLARRTGYVLRAQLVWVPGCQVVALAPAAAGWLNPSGAVVAMAAGVLLAVADGLGAYATGPRPAPAARRLTPS
ncbi:HAD-IC family P-type ATPase [Streptomyces sp. NPDC021225]|uniref:HAD-IC family P-type ATPase n=1 Tax=Streptomyces sp. NPDC021225 TaxID=3365121 RepID=UPI003792DF37